MGVILASRGYGALAKTMRMACDELGIEFAHRSNNRIGRKFPLREETVNDLIFSYHTRRRIYGFNLWHYKPGYIAGTQFIDREGYSGSAEVCRNPNLVDESATTGDLDKSFALAHKMTVIADRSKISKVKSSGEKICDEPYILFPAQVPRDTVIRHSYWGKWNHTLDSVFPALDSLGVRVIVKPHPRAKRAGLKDPCEFFKQFKNIEFLEHNCSIHDAISGSVGVLTVNSGVGFEALVHNKPVFTLGRCDYDYATYKIRTADDIYGIKDRLNLPMEEAAKRYIHYHMNNSIAIKSPSTTAKNMLAFADKHKDR